MNNELLTLTLPELTTLIESWGFPRFRGKQVHEWLHRHHCCSYEDMSNVPLKLRQKLAEAYPERNLQLVDRQVSCDGTRKYILKLDDGCLVETVGMPVFREDGSVERLTVCVSSQVGCPMACSFCATGREGLARNLVPAEIVEQVTFVQRDFEERVSNVVVMGQGEPFLNYDAVIEALRLLNNAEGFNIGARHITLSTCGIIDGIERLSEEPEQFTLAISLHSALQDTRNKLMPKVSHQNLRALKNALAQYIDRTNRRVSLEYLLIDGINDSPEHLDALLGFCHGLLCHVNLLPMNAILGATYQPSPRVIANTWKKTLEEHGIETSMRKSRGSDIDGACGQLKNSFVSRETPRT